MMEKAPGWRVGRNVERRHARAGRTSALFNRQFRLESVGGHKPDHLVEPEQRVFVIAVSVGQAKRRDDRVSRAAPRVGHQRRSAITRWPADCQAPSSEHDCAPATVKSAQK